jgi:RNA polymerase sigma-70 factor, ECF subfamily
MQELVLNPPGTLEQPAAHEAGQSTVRQEFEARLAEYGGLAFRIAQSVLRNAADAEDVAQEALLSAYRKAHKLREPTRIRPWIVRISFRLALDRWRSAKRRKVRETAWLSPESSTARTTEEIVASNQFQEHLERALNQLPEKFRLVLILSAIQGYTLEEISRLLEIPAGTVKSRLFFARKQLAEKLK